MYSLAALSEGKRGRPHNPLAQLFVCRTTFEFLVATRGVWRRLGRKTVQLLPRDRAAGSLPGFDGRSLSNRRSKSQGTREPPVDRFTGIYFLARYSAGILAFMVSLILEALHCILGRDFLGIKRACLIFLNLSG